MPIRLWRRRSPLIDQSGRPIAHDVPCERCGYNLRTLRPDQMCPECRARVANSVCLPHLAAFGHERVLPIYRAVEIMIVSMTLLGLLPLLAFVTGRFTGVHLGLGWLACAGFSVGAVLLARGTARLAMFELDGSSEPIRVVGRLCIFPLVTPLLMPVLLICTNYHMLQVTDLLADRMLGPRFVTAGCLHLAVVLTLPVVMLGSFAATLWQIALVLSAALLWWRLMQVPAETRYAERVARHMQPRSIQASAAS
jgi:hypothetical protein